MQYVILAISVWYIVIMIKSFNELIEIERIMKENEKLAKEVDEKINYILKELTKWK